MIQSFIATKINMTQTWDSQKKRLPVTVLKANPVTVTQVKTIGKDGYLAVQVGIGQQKPSRINKVKKGHLKKSQSNPRYIREVKMSKDSQYKVGDLVTIDQVLEEGDLVKVKGVTKGRGFAGVMKRWGFGGGPRTHGQSDRERAPGSIGQGTDPGRVHKGKKMPGRFGNQTFTVRNLTVLKIDKENSEIWISGPIPGSKNSQTLITKIGKNKKFKTLYNKSDKETPSEQDVKDKEKAKKTNTKTSEEKSQQNKKETLKDKPQSKKKEAD